MSDTILVEIKNSEVILFSGDAKSLSSVNEKGPFDILPFHANFFSIIKEKITFVDDKNKTQEIKVAENGILRVMENKVIIFLGIQTIR